MEYQNTMNNVYSYISRYLNEYKPEVKEADEA